MSAHPEPIEGIVVGVILAGGESSRFGGGDKTLAELDGRPILAHVVERLGPQVAVTVLSANGDPARFAGFGLPVTSDDGGPGGGPLSGVLAGLRWAKKHRPDARWIVTVPSDAPFLPADLCRRLRAGLATSDGIAMATSGGSLHPPFALWPLALEPDLTRWLANDKSRSLRRFADAHGLAEIRFDESGRTNPFFNVNTPADLAIAHALAGARPALLGIAGWKNSGKTTLLTRLVTELTARGLRVATVKHAHHDFDIDQPGKDSHRHRMAGATRIAVVSDQRWAVVGELRGAPEPSLDEIVARLTPADLILVEGFKREPIPRLEVRRGQAADRPPLAPQDRYVIAVAADHAIADALPAFGLDDITTIADFVAGAFRLAKPTTPVPFEAGPGIAEALAVILGDIRHIADEDTVTLDAARGRVATSALTTPGPLPPFDNAAMDGYGVTDGETNRPIETRVTLRGRLAAGAASDVAVGPGETIRINTGAPVPSGIAAIVPHELCRRDGDTIQLPSAIKPGANIRRAGEDVPAGSQIVAAGTLLDPRHIAALATAGIAALSVARRIRVALLATGDELRGATPASIHDTNTPMLRALLDQPAVELVGEAHAPDEAGALAKALADLSGAADLIISTGGIAGGDADLLSAALGRAGGTHRTLDVALRPGRRVLTARLGKSLILGLSGNPLAALVGFLLFGRPLLYRLAGAASPAAEGQPAMAAEVIRHKPGLTEFVPARVTGRSPQGLARLTRAGPSGSARLQPLLIADGLLEIPADAGDVLPGGAVRFHPFDMLRS